MVVPVASTGEIKLNSAKEKARGKLRQPEGISFYSVTTLLQLLPIMLSHQAFA